MTKELKLKGHALSYRQKWRNREESEKNRKWHLLHSWPTEKIYLKSKVHKFDCYGYNLIFILSTLLCHKHLGFFKIFNPNIVTLLNKHSCQHKASNGTQANHPSRARGIAHVTSVRTVIPVLWGKRSSL